MVSFVCRLSVDACARRDGFLVLRWKRMSSYYMGVIRDTHSLYQVPGSIHYSV